MNIKWNQEGIRSITPCPFGKGKMVGSVACDECEYMVLDDKEEQYVLCNADGSMNEKVHLTTAST